MALSDRPSDATTRWTSSTSAMGQPTSESSSDPTATAVSGVHVSGSLEMPELMRKSRAAWFNAVAISSVRVRGRSARPAKNSGLVTACGLRRAGDPVIHS